MAPVVGWGWCFRLAREKADENETGAGMDGVVSELPLLTLLGLVLWSTRASEVGRRGGELARDAVKASVGSHRESSVST